MEKGRVLIAEGSEELALHLSEMLLGSYQVRCCSDGHEAQKLLSQFQPDVLVLDVMLPGVDGLTLLQRALEQGIRTRVLLTTAAVITAVEVFQLFTLVGSCDIDDLILNVIGAALGFLIQNTAKKPAQ